jgi:two-component system OmpR family response regulator/two-component system alkaline phosphatase synthesis response regulator PhoP
LTDRILLVDDDAGVRDVVAFPLRREGFEVEEERDGPGAHEAGRTGAYDLVILDVMLPGLDGITVCRAIRREPHLKDVPILMLTARREESDKVNGLESGADDYLTKPFGMREFIARVRALLRRRRSAANTKAHQAAVTVAGLQVDPARRLARLNQRDIDLTAHEFDLLYVLASNRGIVFSRDSLMQRVWGGDTHITERSVDTLIKRLRKKIESDPAEPRYIVTVWGTGYKFADA